MAPDLKQKMQIAIDDLRATNESCSLALLVDGDTGLVLCKSSDAIVPQEKLDELATSARDRRKNLLTIAMIESSSNPDFMSWVQVHKDAITAVVSPANDYDDALICQFSDMPSRSVLLDTARDALTMINDAEAA